MKNGFNRANNFKTYREEITSNDTVPTTISDVLSPINTHGVSHVNIATSVEAGAGSFDLVPYYWNHDKEQWVAGAAWTGITGNQIELFDADGSLMVFAVANLVGITDIDLSYRLVNRG